MLTLELPVLLSVTVCVPLLPRFRFPKSKLVELAVSCNVAATPVALTAMVVGEAGASLAKDTLAVMLAALAGEKAKLKFALCPRSEERRVGKEGRSRWSPYHYNKKTVRDAVPEL